MPKVKTYTINFDHAPFTIEYTVDNKGTFHAKTPPAVKETLDIGEVMASTLQVCEREFQNVLQQYYNAKTTKRRVIVFAVAATAYIWDAPGERVLFNKDEIHFTNASAVSIGAAVYDECEIKSQDGKVSYRYDEVKDCALHKRSVSMCFKIQKFPPRRYEHQMPYTEEREQFFIKLSQGLEALVLQLDQLKDTDKALAFADSKLQLTQ